MKAGIVEADCLSIEGEVDEGRLTAIQLSHNSLAGEDDPEVLRQMLESLLPLEQAYAAVLDMEVPKPPPLRPSIGTPDTVTVAVTFTPPDVEEIRRVADLSLFAQIEPLDQMRDFLEAVLESGLGYRHAEVDWFRDIRDACGAVEGVEFYHKQGSAFRPGQDRILDGRTHDDYPAVRELQEALAI